jgi:RluA family pseudouridine synthase
MAKPREIELLDGTLIPIVYEDRSVLAIDKPPGWMLAPTSWDRTGRNLQRAIESGILARDFWASSRNLKYLRFIHRLDAETSGVLLMAKSAGSLKAFQQMFETRQMSKIYLAVVKGAPMKTEWSSFLDLAPDGRGRVRIATRNDLKIEIAKPAETHFKVLEKGQGTSLIEARPTTGRTHQIRIHLAADKLPVLGDPIYGGGVTADENWPLALRAVNLDYADPFTGRNIHIAAPAGDFLKAFGFMRAMNKPV